jgi:hypothetical protein
MSYSLGAVEFTAFLKYPVLVGRPTYVIAATHIVLVALGLWLLGTRGWQTSIERIDWKRAFLGGDDPSDRLIRAGLYGTGLLLTVAGFPLHRHYLIVAFPLPWLWLATQARLATRHWQYVLASIWICELVVSVSFLYYIHVNHGALTGDYGATYMFHR